MELNITDQTQNIKAKNKKTGEVLKVNILSVGERQFNCADKPWGEWFNYSKRGDWELFLTMN